jgi:beta-glucosidase
VQSAPPAAIYHDGWIDLNKNGVKDPYEDPQVPVDQRIADLLGRMTMEEKTAQMVTLYGFPRVLKDELPTSQWATSFWKDGIGNIDEQMDGNTGWTNNLAQPKYAIPLLAACPRPERRPALLSSKPASASRRT